MRTNRLARKRTLLYTNETVGYAFLDHTYRTSGTSSPSLNAFNPQAKGRELRIRALDNCSCTEQSKYVIDSMLTVPGVRLFREWYALDNCYKISNLIFVDGGDMMRFNKLWRFLVLTIMLFFGSCLGR